MYRKILPALFLVPLLAGCGEGSSSGKADPALPKSHQVIDVWKLRDDVIRVEALKPPVGDWACEVDVGYEDGGALHAKAQVMRTVCAAEVKRREDEYQHAREAFNREWLPAMMDAVDQGDLVAEVIMRQCSTTPLFDRSGIESSCDKDRKRRDVADKRLREIGFAPAFDLAGEADARRMRNIGKPYVRPQRSVVQQMLLARFRQGVFGFVSDTELLDGLNDGNSPRTEAELNDFRRSEVIDNALMDVQRAFTYAPGFYSAGWHTGSFGALRLNRKPTTPGYLTWGRDMYYKGSSTYWTGRHHWRSGPMMVYLQYANDSERPIAYRGNTAFMDELHETLAASDASIDRYLAQDKRWGVFLIHRVGLHEWVPEGMESDTGKLPPAWQGEWELEKIFVNWKPVPVLAPVRAKIYAEGNGTRIRFDSALREPPCDLRFSGGMTFIPGSQTDYSSATDTPLGYLPAISDIHAGAPEPAEPFAPMDPKVQYPQVLVQCPQGENADSERVRFLLRAGDTLIEVNQEPGARKKLVMKHYRRAY